MVEREGGREGGDHYLSLTDDEIRECVFLSLDQRFDPHLAQAENLTTLFVAMHDGVREHLCCNACSNHSPYLTRPSILSPGLSYPRAGNVYHWSTQQSKPSLRHANPEEGVDSNTDGAGVQWSREEQGAECQAVRPPRG